MKNKKHKLHLLFQGMLFSERVAKGKIKPSAMECWGWGRINAIGASLVNKK